MRHYKYVVLGGGIVGHMVARRLEEKGVSKSDYIVLESKSSGKCGNFMYGTFYFHKPVACFKTRSISIRTTIDGASPTREGILRYKDKIGKGSETEEEWGHQFDEWNTGFALNEEFPMKDLNISYDTYVKSIDLDYRFVNIVNSKGENDKIGYHTLINTLPLSIFTSMSSLSTGAFLPRINFKYAPIYVEMLPCLKPRIRDIEINYFSEKDVPIYRSTICHDVVHFESLREPEKGKRYVQLSPGKLYGKGELIDWVLYVSRDCGVRHFGRFAKWSSNELSHETYEDILRRL